MWARPRGSHMSKAPRPVRSQTRPRTPGLRAQGDLPWRGPTKSALLEVRVDERARLLSSLARKTRDMRWTPALLRIVVEELGVVDDIVKLLGRRRLETAGGIPQVIAVALALRHSWRVDDFAATLRRLRRSMRVSRRATAPRQRATILKSRPERTREERHSR